MKKRLAKVILFTFGTPLLLYQLGLFVNNYITTAKEDHFINDGSISYHFGIMIACGGLGLILLAVTIGILFLIWLILKAIYNYVVSGNF